MNTCPRTLAIYRPGQPMPGVSHHYAYRGNVPLTGRLVCTLCGQDKEDEPAPTPGLLTGAEPTSSAYDDCLCANLEEADRTDPKRALALHGWMTRDFWRSSDGVNWYKINW